MTLLLNRITNVNLQNAGLGEESNTNMTFQTHDEDGTPLGGSSFFTENSSGENSEDIAIVAIDDIVPEDRHISILQLDVEGFEEVALKGAMKTIARCKPILILEIIPDSTLLTDTFFQESIIGLGYKKQGHVHGNVIYHP